MTRITGSPALRLAWSEFVELLKTAGIVGIGAAVGALSEQQLDWSSTSGLLTASGVMLVLHVARKLGFDTRGAK